MRKVLFFIASLLTLAPAFANDFIYVMQPGDSIWQISQEMLTNPQKYQALAIKNNIQNPLAVSPGVKIKIPSKWLKRAPASARVIVTQGSAWLERPGTATRALQISDEILAHDTLRIEADGGALLGFADGSQLQVNPNTTVRFDRLTAFGNKNMVDTEMRLLQGSVDSRVSKRQSPSLKFDIQTPISLAAVRGTDYRVAYAEAQQVGHTEVIEGRVQVSNALGATALPAKTGSVSHKDQPPSKAIPLLPAIALDGLPTLIEYLPPSLKLNPIQGAVRYEIQVSTDAKFETNLAQKTFDSPAWRINDLADGNYWLRIRGIDNNGLRGLDAIHAITVAARPEPPLLMEPKAKGVVRGTEAQLRWSESTVAKSYRLKLSKAGAQPSVVFNEILEGTQHSFSTLPEGAYIWQVASIDAQGKQGPLSEAQAFSLLPAPANEPPSVEGDELQLRWRAVDGDVIYGWQFARDNAFTDLVQEGETRSPSVSLPRPEGGEYFFRLRVIDEPANPPAYGVAQKVEVPLDWSWLAPFGVMLVLILL